MWSDNKHPLPFRSKLEMCEEIAQIVCYLHYGDKRKSDPLIEDLKIRSLYLDETIQQDVLAFSEQVQFQYAYDPSHQVTKDVQKAADRLLKDLGFEPLPSYSLLQFFSTRK